MQKGNKKREREKDPDAIQRTGHLLFYSLESSCSQAIDLAISGTRALFYVVKDPNLWMMKEYYDNIFSFMYFKIFIFILKERKI